MEGKPKLLVVLKQELKHVNPNKEIFLAKNLHPSKLIFLENFEN